MAPAKPEPTPTPTRSKANLKKVRKVAPSVQSGLSRGLADIIVKLGTGRITVATAARRLRAAADWLEAAALRDEAARPKPSSVEDLPTGDERVVFEHWHSVTGQSEQVRLTPKRRDVIRARLGAGYTVAQLCAVVDVINADPHWCGENDRGIAYRDRLDYVLRSDERVDEKLRIARESGGVVAPVASSGGSSAKIRDLERMADEAMERGDFDAFNELQGRLREVRDGGNDRAKGGRQDRGDEKGRI